MVTAAQSSWEPNPKGSSHKSKKLRGPKQLQLPQPNKRRSMKLKLCAFALSSLVAKTCVCAGTVRGRNLAPADDSTPSCDEIHNNASSLFCLEDCGTEYWQCVNGEVLAAPMPDGIHCLDGEFDVLGKCTETERDERCDEIEALKAEDKIMCTDECSSHYLACSNGIVIQMPMTEGTKCYHNGIAHTSEGQCVIEGEVITYFELMDACKNYPDLEHCASSADPDAPPYHGAVFDDGAWYFSDKVWFSYIATDSEEHGKGWDVFVNIRFGHDHEMGRSRSIIASMDYGTTEIRKWHQYDLVDGDEDNKHYNCEMEIPDEPVTKFIAQLIKNPIIIFGLGRGDLDIPDDDEVHDYTAQVTVPASELGIDCDDDDDEVSVLVESDNAAEDESGDLFVAPVVTPTFLFKNVVVYVGDFGDDEDASDSDEDSYDGDEIDESDDEGIPEFETIDEVRKLLDEYFNVTLNETVCSEGYEQVYDSETDVVFPVTNRGKLTVGAGVTDNESETIIEEGTEELSDQLDPIARKLMKLGKQKKQEKIPIPQHSIDVCKDGEILVDHCCSENEHYLSCSPTADTQNCPPKTVASSRCLERNIANDVIVEPNFLRGNIPMQLHTVEHLESLEYELDNILPDDLEDERVSERKLYWEDNDEWVKQSAEDFTSEENFLPRTRSMINKWVNSPINDNDDLTAEVLFDNFGDLFLGRGGGLPNVKNLLADLSDLDKTLSKFYDFNTDLEEDMLSIFELMNSVDTAEEELKNIDNTLMTLDRVLQMVSIISYAKPIAIPIRNAVRQTRQQGVGNALGKVKSIRSTVTKKYKPKLKKALTKNEDLRGFIAKSRFLNQNLIINSFNTTRNCKPSDEAAGYLSPIIGYATVDADSALDGIQQFRESIHDLVGELSGVIILVDDMVEAIEETTKKADPIKKAMDPFYKALSTKISIPIWGPFCHRYVDISIPYPCGIKRCKRCWRFFRRRRCIRYPCGVKRCYWRKRVRLPVFCTKTFSFTINQILSGISGVMDIIFWPLNKAMDAILKAIPMPDIPLLPPFPTDFGEIDQMKMISNLLEGPKFPSNLLDYGSIDLALPGLEDMVCGRSAEDLLDVLEMAKNGDITPQFVREFYDGCGGLQNLNPMCDSTDELLCGDGECPTTESPTLNPSSSPSIGVTASPTESPTTSPTDSPSTNPSDTSDDGIANPVPTVQPIELENEGTEDVSDEIHTTEADFDLRLPPKC